MGILRRRKKEPKPRPLSLSEHLTAMFDGREAGELGSPGQSNHGWGAEWTPEMLRDAFDDRFASSSHRTWEDQREMLERYMVKPLPAVPPGHYVLHSTEGGGEWEATVKGTSSEEMRRAVRPAVGINPKYAEYVEMGTGKTAVDWGRSPSPLEALDRDVERVCAPGRGDFSGDFASGGVIEHAVLGAGRRRELTGTMKIDMFDEGFKDSIERLLQGR